ncbi:MAG: CHAT domain-containing tetratricopeptide repeat protein [Cyanobacteria bacterium J06638_20]
MHFLPRCLLPAFSPLFILPAIIPATLLLRSQPALAQTDITDRRTESIELNNRGQQLVAVGRYEEALVLYEQALAIVRDIGERQGEGAILTNIGLVYVNLGQSEQALDYYYQSLDISQDIDDRLGQGRTLNNIGAAYQNLSQYEQALTYYQQGLAISREIGDRRTESSTLNNMGLISSNLGNYEQALAYYQQSLPRFEEIGDRGGQVSSLTGIGAVHRHLGQYEPALRYFQQSLAISQEIGDRLREGTALNNLGGVYTNLGQYASALRYFQRSLAIRQAIGNRAGEARTLNNIGSIHVELEDYEQALQYYQQSLPIRQAIGDRAGEAATLNNIGEVYRNVQQFDQALQHYQQSLPIRQAIGDRAGEATTLNNIGLMYLNQGQYAQALQYYQQSLPIRQAIGDRAGEGITLTGIGAAYHSLGQYPQAEQALYQAIAVLESLRAEDLSDINQVSLFDTQIHPYEWLQLTLVAQGETDTALEVAERSRARVLLEALLAGSATPETRVPSSHAPDIATMRSVAQEQNATLVNYSIIDYDTATPILYVWVMRPTGTLYFESVDLSQLDQNLADLVGITRQALNVRSRNEAEAIISLTPAAQERQQQIQAEALQTLYQLLIDPISAYLPNAPEERIVFIPHRSLYLVPFPALMDANGDYLIEHHTMLTAPSIQVLDLIRQPQSLSGDALSAEDLLLVGNPIMPSVWNPNTGQSERLSSLPGAEDEAAAIETLTGAAPLLWEAASEATVKAQMPNAQVIHLATHGLLDYGNPEETGVLDFPGAVALAPGNGEDGLLTSAEILQMELNAELVVLSACDTGRGRITGDGVVGLSRAFMQAGVPSLIVALWKVPDDATAFLMTEFYENWQTEGDRAQALRQAMLTTMEEYPDPINWAAFTLVGQAE